MSNFADVKNKFRSFNEVLNEVFNSRNIQEWMTETLQNRLYKDGVTGTGIELKTDESLPGMPYSPATMDIKSFQGKRIRNVTLKDDEDFYDSFRIILNLFGFEIEADFIKGGGHIHDNFTNQFTTKKEFEEAVLSLTESEIDYMINKMVIPEIKRKYDEIF
jgi:hypothetical protein